jgi:acylphosphatase
MSSCRRCLISGLVQGVWFRGNTQRRAQQLGITGHAQNLPDGRVEVLACGEPEALEQLQAWLWQGPTAARVESVECEAVSMTPPTRFTTG